MKSEESRVLNVYKGEIMVKIHECQYVIDNSSNRQERDIEYHSWNKYVDDILNSPRRQDLAYPSLPRNSKVDKVIEMTNDKLMIRFYHFMIGQTVEHVATLLSTESKLLEREKKR